MRGPVLSRSLVRRAKSNEDHSVSWDSGLEVSGGGFQVALAPEVSDGVRAGYAEVGPRDFDGSHVFADVEEADGDGAVGEGLRPDFFSVGLPNRMRHRAQRVLVDVKNFVVG